MLNLRLNKRGEGNLLWYISYFMALVAIFGVMTYLGVHTFTVHTNTAEVSNELIAEYAYRAPYTIDPYTGERSNIRSNMNERIAQLNQGEREFAMRIKIGNETYYSDEDKFDILLATVGPSSILKRSATRHGMQTVEVSVVMAKT